MRLQKGMLLLSLALSITLEGCSTVVLHPITPDDIFPVKAGVSFGSQTVVKDGWFLSSEYVEEVMKAKVETK